MKWSYKILRAILVASLVMAVGLPSLIYIFLSLSPVQDKARDIAQTELSKLLDTRVTIGRVSLSPFNRVTLENVLVGNPGQDTIMTVGRLGAGIDLGTLIMDRQIVITYVELIGLDARLNRATPRSPLNIAHIIDALKPKDHNKPPTPFDLQVDNIVIRRSAVSYDILSDTTLVEGRFSPAHIRVSDLKADIRLPRIKNNDFTIDIKRLVADERSGLSLSGLSGLFHITSTGASVGGLTIELPATKLKIADTGITYDSFNTLSRDLRQRPLSIEVMEGSYLSLSDFAALLPALKGLDENLDIALAVNGTVNSMSIDRFSLSDADNNIWLKLNGHIDGIGEKDKDISVDFPHIDFNGYGVDLSDLASSLSHISPKGQQILSNLGHISMVGHLKGSAADAAFKGTIATAPGNVTLDTHVSRRASRWHLSGKINAADIAVGKLLSDPRIGSLGVNAQFDALFARRIEKASFNGQVDHFEYNGHRYNAISADVTMNGDRYDGTIAVDDDGLRLFVEGSADIGSKTPGANLYIDLADIDLNALNLWNKYPGHKLSGALQANWKGGALDNGNGNIDINALTFIDDNDEGIHIDHIGIEAVNTDSIQYINLRSDLVEGSIAGQYDFASVVSTSRDILSHVFPVFFGNKVLHDAPDKPREKKRYNNFSYNFTIKDNNQLVEFFKSPLRLIYPITITGLIDEESHEMALDIDAPYLQQKDKLIENTALRFNVDGAGGQGRLFATTTMPTKNGPMAMFLQCNGASDRLDTDLSWKVDNSRNFHGNVNLSTLFGNAEQGDGYTANIAINRSQLVFNDTAWTVNPAKIDIDMATKRIDIDNIDVRRDNQYVNIDGTVSPNPDDELCLQLLDVNLDYVFETLGINNVMFGGDASGKFYASGLLSKEPHLSTPGLHVKGFKYNFAPLGDADIISSWDNATRGVKIDATILQPNGRKSYIDGAIYPLADSLDFRFKADKIDVRFMKPYMSAFTSDVSGYASGEARLWGTFKLIDMTGRLYAEDLKVKLDYTNTYYTTSDSVIMTPGHIGFDRVTLHDAYGHTAQLSGWVTHKCFKEPRFRFEITRANNFLCYDVNSSISPDWYGKIFCNGTAFVNGVPGAIDIDVNMSTAPNSTFTFVLSDTEAAGEYTFIEFRDREKLKAKEVIDTMLHRGTPELARLLRSRIKKQEQSNPSLFKINLQVDVTPDAQMLLIMDPAGGDRIRANGSGNLRLEYVSTDDDFKMFGTYTLDHGDYNFTLQDIIIKDFTINPGSSIAFHGDPLAATLDIEAIYAVNANLTDLDESFMEDRDLNRTNVPVHALLQVSGDMRQPDIKFDLDFPTLSSDVYRKVRSIISTDEMMNRQILYLIALNRFYTPDYMASTTKGSELMSVASSTISSQLSSMLGQLSDNWSIAPNFRSDKGDFSDVEVDLALSSHLLNNRLLFNGNFGYRDKSLNNNSFIGDFDIEYLLNSTGNIRLKAYNRYNDQNYYVKTALTTQGVGIVFKRDFDNIFSFLRPVHKLLKGKSGTGVQPDSLSIKTRNDSTLVGTKPTSSARTDSSTRKKKKRPTQSTRHDRVAVKPDSIEIKP